MQIHKQLNNNSDKLILFFSGWSTSPEIVGRLEVPENTDLWICYDYRDLTFREDVSGYRDITLIAWSLGVWVASTLFDTSGIRFSRAIAINGTPYPVDDQLGIPETIFLGTMEHITEEGIQRFNRRMCGNREILRQYEQYPIRPIQETEAELKILFQQIKARKKSSPDFWTKAVLSVSDRIFPIENLRNYWQGTCPVTEINAPHYPFYLWKQWNEMY